MMSPMINFCSRPEKSIVCLLSLFSGFCWWERFKITCPQDESAAFAYPASSLCVQTTKGILPCLCLMRTAEQKEQKTLRLALRSQNMNEFSPALGSVHRVVTKDFNAILKMQTDLTNFYFPHGSCSK